MNNEELDKLRYHIRLIDEALSSLILDLDGADIKSQTSLVRERNWTEDDLKKVHDIFDAHYNDGEIELSGFEAELKQTFGISYQTVKTIVLAFFRDGYWVDLCTQYAKEHDCVEFHEITRKR